MFYNKSVYCSLSSTVSQSFVGRYVVPRSAKAEIMTMATYANQPPRRCCSRDTEKRDVDATGPMARTMEMQVCEMPFVVPRECLLGAADRT
jgi:hypothetical protein